MTTTVCANTMHQSDSYRMGFVRGFLDTIKDDLAREPNYFPRSLAPRRLQEALDLLHGRGCPCVWDAH